MTIVLSAWTTLSWSSRASQSLTSESADEGTCQEPGPATVTGSGAGSATSCKASTPVLGRCYPISLHHGTLTSYRATVMPEGVGVQLLHYFPALPDRSGRPGV